MTEKLNTFNPDEMSIIINALAYTYRMKCKACEKATAAGKDESAENANKAAAEVYKLFDQIRAGTDRETRILMTSMIAR